MDRKQKDILSKVPEVILIFWVIKILATTLGETGGDLVSMSMNLGYLVSTIIFTAIFIVAVIAQVFAKKIPSYPLLGNNYCNNNSGNDISGFRGLFSWYWLCGRDGNIAYLAL